MASITIKTDVKILIKKLDSIVHKLLENAIKNSFSQLTLSVIRQTPVLTGHLRGNWQASLNSAKTMELPITDPQGISTYAMADTVIKTYHIKNPMFLANNVPYGELIELGYSQRKAPQGMQRVSVLRWPDMLKAEVDKVKGHNISVR